MSNSLIYILKIIYRADNKRIFIEVVINLYKQFFITFFGVFFLRTVILFLEQGKSFQHIIAILCLMLMINFIFYVLRNWFYENYKPRSDAEIKEKIDLMIYSKASTLEGSYFEDVKNYNLYYRLLEKKDMLPRLVLGHLGMAAGACFALLLLLSYMVLTDIAVLFIAVVPALAIYIAGSKLSQIEFLKSVDNTLYQRKKEYCTRVFYMKNYAEELRMTHVGQLIKHLYEEGTLGLIQNSKQYGLKIALLAFFKNAVTDVGIVIIALIYVLYRIMVSKTLLIGDYVGLSQAVLCISNTLTGLSQNLSELKGISLSIAEFQAFMCLECEHNLGTMKPESKQIKIAFKSVGFQYNEKEILKDISLTIEKRQKIAIVGRNGAGKTTLINLLIKIFDATEGQITLNDNEVREYNPIAYRHIFSYIPQDYHLYAMSMQDNITMGTPETELGFSVMDALEQTGLKSKFAQTNINLNTDMTKEFETDGLEFSGGDIQKMALARLMVQGRPILILDEPSSALDPIAEKDLFEKTFNTFSDHTIIFISHRLATTKFADRIYFMSEGQIVESGSHEELMTLQCEYATLYNMQAEKYRNRGEYLEKSYVSHIQ